MKPLKRLPQLHVLSHDHHQGLLYCWKIRKGVNNEIDPLRMFTYTKWFFKEHLEPHFRQEEDHYFPLLGSTHPLVLRACNEHRAMEKMLSEFSDGYLQLLQFADLLESHIRFEERELFEALQQHVTPVQWQQLEKLETEAPSCSEFHDPFWV